MTSVSSDSQTLADLDEANLDDFFTTLAEQSEQQDLIEKKIALWNSDQTTSSPANAEKEPATPPEKSTPSPQKTARPTIPPKVYIQQPPLSKTNSDVNSHDVDDMSYDTGSDNASSVDDSHEFAALFEDIEANQALGSEKKANQPTENGQPSSEKSITKKGTLEQRSVTDKGDAASTTSPSTQAAQTSSNTTRKTNNHTPSNQQDQSIPPTQPTRQNQQRAMYPGAVPMPGINREDSSSTLVWGEPDNTAPIEIDNAQLVDEQVVVNNASLASDILVNDLDLFGEVVDSVLSKEPFSNSFPSNQIESIKQSATDTLQNLRSEGALSNAEIVNHVYDQIRNHFVVLPATTVATTTATSEPNPTENNTDSTTQSKKNLAAKFYARVTSAFNSLNCKRGNGAV